MTKKPKRNEPDKIAAALEALSETQPAAEPSLIQQVGKHFERIEKLRARGHSFAAIAEALQQVGMDIAEKTLTQYFGRLRRQRAQTQATKPKQVTVRQRKPDTMSAPPEKDQPRAPARGDQRIDDSEAWLTNGPDESNI